MIVVDASVLVDALGDDGPDGHAARARLRGAAALAAPDVADVETVAGLRRRWLTGMITARRFSAAIGDLTDFDIDRFPTRAFLTHAYELRDNVTSYDAMYVALAEALDCPLVTTDGRLARAPGPRCPIELLAS